MNHKFIFSLYQKYYYDVLKMKKEQLEFYFRLHPSFRDGVAEEGPYKAAFDDIEGEITYMLIREYKPKKVLEVSPCTGWSSSYILRGLNDNNFGELHSFDLTNLCLECLALDESLTKTGRFNFYLGDVRKNLADHDYDYVLWDSEHNDLDFTNWYLNYFGQLRKGIPISIHDIFNEEPILDVNNKEILPVLKFIYNKDYVHYGFFDFDYKRQKWLVNQARKNMDEFRARLRIPNIHSFIKNGSVFFNL